MVKLTGIGRNNNMIDTQTPLPHPHGTYPDHQGGYICASIDSRQRCHTDNGTEIQESTSLSKIDAK